MFILHDGYSDKRDFGGAPLFAFIVLNKNYNQIDKRKSPRITAYERIKIDYKYISAQAFSSPILTDGRKTFASVISAPSLR